jgi:hypothetical protein
MVDGLILKSHDLSPCLYLIKPNKISWSKHLMLIFNQIKRPKANHVIFKISERFYKKKIKNNNGAQSFIK